MATATWIKNELEERGVTFEELHHREVFTTQEVAQSEHISGHRVAKVVIAMADGRPIELVLPASRRIVLEQVRQLWALRKCGWRLRQRWTGFSMTSTRGPFQLCGTGKVSR